MRRGFQGLTAQIQTVLEQQPFSGHVFVLRERRGDIVKVLWFDGDGLCLLAKQLEHGRFVWTEAVGGTVSLRHAQLSMLLEGIDWRAPIRPAEPVMSVWRSIQFSCGFSSIARLRSVAYMRSCSPPCCRDLDSLDLEAVKALLIAQHEEYTAT